MLCWCHLVVEAYRLSLCFGNEMNEWNVQIFRKMTMLTVSTANPAWSVKRIGIMPIAPSKAIIMSNHLSNGTII
jgi:hypothetical protein